MADQAHIAGLGDADRRTEILRARSSQVLSSRIDVLEAGYVNVQNGTYTPTLTGMAIGTGGSAANSAAWSFAGGELVGDVGVLTVEGKIIFGAAGTTFPAADIRVSLPSGFNLVTTDIQRHGLCLFLDGGTTYGGVVWRVAATEWRMVAIQNSGTYEQHVATSTTVPFAWGAGDGINWVAAARAVRV